MNFEKLPPVDSGAHLLDLAFRKARESGQKKLTGSWLEIIKKKDSLKLDVVKDTLVSRLVKVISSFPNSNELGNFYQQLMKLTLDHHQYKKSLAALNWGIDKIRAFHRSYVSKINRNYDRKQIGFLSTQCYGRISSVIKQISSDLKYLEQCRRIMRTYPDIKEMFTVCIYGFPNVGKTTLLNKLTGTKAEVAAYSFTTKSINAGYLSEDGKMVQVLDVPGTLAREEKMNNIELQAELVRKELASLIIYVFDLSESSSYSSKKQEQLFRKLGKEKKILVYFSKMDLIKNAGTYAKKYRPLGIQGLKEKIKELYN